MKAPVSIVESALSPFSEAIQPAQLMRAERQLAPRIKGNPAAEGLRVSDAILKYVGAADPTVEKDGEGFGIPSEAAKGKYAAWLLGLWLKGDKATKSVNWAEKYPHAAVAQGLIDIPTDSLPHEWQRLYDAALRGMRRDVTRKYDWMGHKHAVLRALEAHRRIVKLGRTEEFGIEADINRYKTVSDLLSSVDVDPETVHSKATIRKGAVSDPLNVEGSELYKETDRYAIYVITTAEAAMYHGADTNWCFKDAGNAASYTENGPLYVVYVKAPEAGRSVAPYRVGGKSTIRSSRQGYFKFLAISPFSSNVDTVDDYEDEDLWEIRDVENKWFSDTDTLVQLVAEDFLDVLFNIAQDNPGGAVGFSIWRAFGTYDKKDLGLEDEDEEEGVAASISDPGWTFMSNWGYDPDDVDSEGDIDISGTVDTDNIITRANLASWGGGTVHVQGSTPYVNVFTWDEDGFNAAQSIMQGSLMDDAIDNFYELRDELKEEKWESEYREAFRYSLVQQVQSLEDDGVVEFDFLMSTYRVPTAAFIDGIEAASDGELDNLAQDQGNLEWDDELDDDPVAHVDEAAQNIAAEDIADGVDLEYDQYEVEDEEEEDEEETPPLPPVANESRCVMRRIMMGAAK